jgi:hypothetical protein
MGSPTLHAVQEPILLLRWVCFRGCVRRVQMRCPIVLSPLKLPSSARSTPADLYKVPRDFPAALFLLARLNTTTLRLTGRGVGWGCSRWAEVRACVEHPTLQAEALSRIAAELSQSKNLASHVAGFTRGDAVPAPHMVPPAARPTSLQGETSTQSELWSPELKLERA